MKMRKFAASSHISQLDKSSCQNARTCF